MPKEQESNHPRPFTSAKKPTFRLFEADESRDESRPSREWPLSRLYREAFAPVWLIEPNASLGTRQAYEEAVNWWVKITHDPPIRLISDETCAVFLEQLAKQPGRKRERMSPMTLRKHATCLNRVLAFAGPKVRNRIGRKNLHLIDDPAYIDRPQKIAEEPDGEFTRAEVMAMLSKCHRRKMPKVPGVTPEAWWRALIVVACQTGLRIGTLMQLEFSHLRDGEWLVIPADIIKGRRSSLKQFVHPEARAAIESIRTSRRLIFDWPNGRPWPTSTRKRSMNVMLHRLMTDAGIPEARQRWRAFHACRKYQLTGVYALADSTRAGEDAAQASAGHRRKDTTLGHYVAKSAQDQKAAAAISKLPKLSRGAKQSSSPALLLTFFERSFVPEALAGASPNRVRSYRNAIGQLSKRLGRKARIDDLSEANCRRMLGLMVAAELGEHHIAKVRKRLLAIWRYAHRLQLVGPPVMPRLKRRAPKNLRIPPAAGELSDYFETTFLPQNLRGKRPGYAFQYRRALRKLNEILGQPATINDLLGRTVPELEEQFVVSGISAAHAATLVRRLRTLQRHLAEKTLRDNPEAWL